MDMQAFGETLPKALRFLRHKADLTQEELAKKAGVTPSMVSNYERGKEQPSLPTLIRLVAALGCDFCDLNEAAEVLTEYWTQEAREERRRVKATKQYFLLDERMEEFMESSRPSKKEDL